MNKVERMTMVKAMEFITRNLNDEEVFSDWLAVGVVDGDIDVAPYGDFNTSRSTTTSGEIINKELVHFRTLLMIVCRSHVSMAALIGASSAISFSRCQTP